MEKKAQMSKQTMKEAIEMGGDGRGYSGSGSRASSRDPVLITFNSGALVEFENPNPNELVTGLEEV